MVRWSFDDDKLLKLVLNGKKKATSSVYNNNLPTLGEESIITKNNKDICKIKIVGYKLFKFKEAKEEDILKEGEGNLKQWRKIHLDFFKKYYNDFNDETIILFEEFEVVNIYIKNSLNE